MKVEEVRLDEQKQFEDVGVFPFAFAPQNKDSSIEEAVEWVKDNKDKIEEILLRHGAILFRGFPIVDPLAFDKFVASFGYINQPYSGGAAPRNHIVGNVFTANESPPEVEIPFHHEMSQSVNTPKKLFFYCGAVPNSGGETPICLSNEVYKRMVDKYKDSTQKLEQLGAHYARILPEETDDSSPQGRGWKATYFVSTREEVEKVVTERGLNFEWLPNGDLKTTSAAPMPAIQVDVRTGLKVWYNGIVPVYTAWNDSRHVGPKCVTFGDGAPFDSEFVFGCYRIMNEICVKHKWEQGDVLLVDNRTTMHARCSYVGNRKVYASLTMS